MTYIDPRGKVFAHIERLAGWRGGDTPAPVTIEWDLSARCPLGCQSCHFAYTHTRGPWTGRTRMLPMAYDGVGDLADATLVQTALADAWSMDGGAGVRSIVWSGGGEPTTHPKWREIVQWAADLGYEQGMYTMAGLLSESDARHLTKCLTWVVVSLDAADAETYGREKGVPAQRFDAAVRGARWLAEQADAVVGISFLLHAGNWTRAAEMLQLGTNIGADYVTFRPTIQTSPDVPGECGEDRAWITDAEELLEALADEENVEIDPDRFYAYRDWRGHGYGECLGIRLATTVTPDGRVWICPNRRGFAGSCLGDLKTESFQSIWSRHPGKFMVDGRCRVMCRMHAVNETLAAVEQPRAHEAFI